MIQATYDKNTKSAPATGAVQYDAGQEIYLYGLPESLSGTLEMQFAYAGDAKAEGRMAEYDAAKKAWKARVPNKYLTRARAVNVYLYQTLDQETAGTIYTAVFTPLGRSAPGGEVTPDEISQWGELVGQFTAKMAEMDAAIGHANEAAANVRIELEGFGAEKAEWEARLQSAEETAKSASDTAKDAKETAIDAKKTALSAANLLDNSNFARPVNQRGRAEYTGTGYTIDRWRMANVSSKLTVTDGGVTLSPNGGNAYMAQSIDDGFTSYLGKTYTFAVMTAEGVVHTVTGTMPTQAPTSETILGSKSISSGTIYILVRANRTCPTVQIRVNQDSGGVALKWAALYEGAYTAETIPSYRPRAASMELLECQRYLHIVRPGTAYLPLCWGLVKNASTIWYNVVFPTQMRVIPTFTYGGDLVCNASVYDNISDLSIRFADTQRAMLAATAESGAQVPDTASVLCGKAADAYLMFSAEL